MPDRRRDARKIATCLAAVLATSAAVSALRADEAVVSMPDAKLEPVGWPALPGWIQDDHAAAFDTFLTSCEPIVAAARRAKAEPSPVEAALAPICAEARALGPARAAEARTFFESRFRPVRISKLEEPEGFLTGYYEPIVEGSRQPTQEYKVPIYRRPEDLVSTVRKAGLGFPNKGGAWRRINKRKKVPYYDRAEIEDGALDGKGLEICWLKDPIDAFFIQIQGSARVRLEDGAVLRLNYAAHNGYPYTPIGGILVRRGEVPKDEMSMDRIRDWMQANPQQGKELRRQNRSFVFFRVAELKDHEEAVGGQGIPLTPGRSLAVDRKLHIYGTPFWIDAELPLSGDGKKDRFRRLMIAQDTGSAIVGPARGDLYFGAGTEAGQVAGRIKNPARFVMLVPRSLALTGIAQPVPYPPAKPKSSSSTAANQ